MTKFINQYFLEPVLIGGATCVLMMGGAGVYGALSPFWATFIGVVLWFWVIGSLIKALVWAWNWKRPNWR